ncbi:ABC transporter ATP-binding protein [Jiella pelagia]|uniref:ABC transporter ATP-binding protein n=1 Tax=Jiella pelagia TaxID=2986949 RepID=A0ABY7BY78_9HYPH|nr:ABC transporter ATP-binding protein [Jiella pelagia]WAP68372.1 ABC transporter ATP-binding protein [Jiella pelagia]
MLLEAKDLSVVYGRTRAVDGVDISVGEGEIVTVLGANGAGKTSLLRALQGAVKPSRGRIVLAGRDVTNGSSAARVAGGMVLVPEGRQIFVSMSVHENLLMGAYLRRDGGIETDIAAIYERFPNLARRRDMKASVLSGGEQQMLAIGRALVARPRLIMLDEPSLGLSPLFVEQLFSLLKDLNRDGIAILLVEQNTSMALELATRGYVFELGDVVLQGPAEELLGNQALVAAYLGGGEAAPTEIPPHAGS